MKMNQRLALFAAMAILSNQGFAGESGTRGGGHVLDVDSTPHLMDLVTKAVCDWKKGEEFLSEVPSLDDALTKLARLDWYFASELEKEISAIDFCMTGPLYRVAAYEYDSMVKKPFGERPRQAGYRLNENAYIDADIFSAMPEAERGMLIVHETMHSYLDMKTHDRALKLRSMVKVIDQVRKGEIVSRTKLHLAMQKNEINFPTTVAALDAKEDAVLFLKASLPEQMAIFKGSSDPEALIDLSEKQVSYLAPWDQQLAKNRTAALKEAMLGAFQNAEPAELTKLIDKKVYKKIDPVMVALSDFYSFTKEQQAAVVSSKRFNSAIEKGLQDLAAPQVFYDANLFMVTEKFKVVGETKEAGNSPLLKLDPVSKFPAALQWLPEMMMVLFESGEIKRITNNEAFYEALTLGAQSAEVAKVKPKIEREKLYALTRLELLSKALVHSLFEYLELRMEPAKFEEMMKEIKKEKFQ